MFRTETMQLKKIVINLDSTICSHDPGVDLWPVLRLHSCLYTAVLQVLKSSCCGLSGPYLRFHTLYLMIKPETETLKWHEGNINIIVSSKNWEAGALLASTLMSNNWIIKCWRSVRPPLHDSSLLLHAGGIQWPIHTPPRNKPSRWTRLKADSQEIPSH